MSQGSRRSPPHQEGIESLPAGGFASQGSRPSPPCQEGIESLPAGGFASRARAQGSRRPPTRQEGYLPPREVALVHGGQNPITPQSKTTSRPPAPRCMFLTEVTSMSLVNTCGEIDLCTPRAEAHPPWRVCERRLPIGGWRPSPPGV